MLEEDSYIIELLVKKIMIILFIIVLTISGVWLAGFVFANDFSVPSSDISKYKNLLVVFPHADDEVINAGGLIHKLAKQGSKVTLVILTKGEKGTPDAHLEPKLKEIRTQEAQDVGKILGVTKIIQEDFGDGEIINKKDEVTKYLEGVLKDVKPDLVVTYDLSGFYGHPDHIAVSEIVTDLVKTNYTDTPLWYVSFPKRILGMMKLPEQMAKDPNFKDKRSVPTMKIFVLDSVLIKISGVYAYKSQYESFASSLPVRFVPPAFFYSMGWFEYFSKAN